MKNSLWFVAFISFIFASITAIGQSVLQCEQLVETIGQFEGQRDPKCAATANRLEDFMFGTPLLESARHEKNTLQKGFVLEVWLMADSIAKGNGNEQISAQLIKSILDQRLSIEGSEHHYIVSGHNKNAVKITKRDLSHYSSVAYSYRSILALQQELIFDAEWSTLPINKDGLEVLKDFLDISTLAVLNTADGNARSNNRSVINAELIKDAWEVVFGHLPSSKQAAKAQNQQTFWQQQELVRQIIAKKKASFQEYNHINMFLFQRNAQVYFSRHKWPKDEAESRALKVLYNEMLIQFVKDLWSMAESRTETDCRSLISLNDVNDALKRFLPFSMNQLEDITFFPKLNRSDQIDIEAYDLDAFRDGGAHWTYLEMALSDSSFSPKYMPTPFALELLSESVAHLGVLSLRIAGNIARRNEKSAISAIELQLSLNRIQQLINEHANVKEKVVGYPIVSAFNVVADEINNKYFTDITSRTGIEAMHRSSDWLSRAIRSYSIDTTENIIRTSIPPAFGGSGVASEDLNNDGYPDLLILSGVGNKLYLNNGNGTFTDHTAKSGIAWLRSDNTYGEPRQPIIADFDNDGRQDIFISYVNDQHRIYRNTGNAVFEDVTEVAKLGGTGLVGGPCTAFDQDNDGLLDIYIGYFGDYIHGVHPTLARQNKNGLANKFFRNKGHFKFEDVTSETNTADNGWSQSIGHTDLNNDGFQDLIVGNDFGTNTYYLNNGAGKGFTDATRDLGTDKPSFTMNVGITDLNRDHLPDLYISNIVVMEKDEKYISPSDTSKMRFNAESMSNMRVVEANDLFLSNANTSNSQLQYRLSDNVGTGYSSTGWSWDADFFDFDNDGDQDLYCLTGMNDFLVYSKNNPYFKSGDGGSLNVTFADSRREANVFFENDNGKLNVVSDKSGANTSFNSRSATFLDIEMDGDLDIVVNNYHDSAVVFSNNSQNSNTWLKLRLIGSVENNVNLDAIGAKIIVTATDLDVWHEVHSTTGYLSVHPKEQHIGTFKYSTVNVKVVWPNGYEQHFKDIETGQRYLLNYGGEIRKRDFIEK